LLSVNDGEQGRGLEIGFGLRFWRGLRFGFWEEPEGYDPRTLFDNFIGRKRDVDGGVLAGSFVGESWREGRKRQLTVTFQTTIPVGFGLSERREMFVRLICPVGIVFGTRQMGSQGPDRVERL
jgi:hypothetical protein